MRAFRNSLLFLWLAVLPARADVPAVRQTALHRITPDAYGLTVPRDKAMWERVAFPAAKNLIGQMKPFSPAATAMQTDILLSTAQPPAFTPPFEWLNARMAKLFDWGLFKEVAQLGEKIPPTARSAAQNGVIVNALLLTDFQKACAFDADNTEKIRLICSALNGDEDEIFRQIEIVKEQADDDFTVKAAEAFVSGASFTALPPALSPLNIAVLRLAGIDFSEKVSERSPLWVQKAFVETAGIPAEKRLPFAERLAQKGLLSPAVLKRLYDDAEFLTGDLKTDFENAEKRGVAAAFALAEKDRWAALEPSIENLADSAWVVKGLTAAGLSAKAQDWFDKAEILHPDSPTVENGWFYTELEPKDEHYFSFRLKPMIDRDTSAERLDDIMAVFLALDLLPNGEYWNLSAREMPEALSLDGTAVENELNALAALTKGRDGVLQSLQALKRLGFEKEALRIAVEADILP